jgi:hypothetical protein
MRLFGSRAVGPEASRPIPRDVEAGKMDAVQARMNDVLAEQAEMARALHG